MKIWDPIMGKGVGMGILSSHAERRRFKSKNKIKKRRKKSLLAKARKGGGQLTVGEIELGPDRGVARCTWAEVCGRVQLVAVVVGT